MNQAQIEAEVRRLAGEIADAMVKHGAETVGELPQEQVNGYRARLEELGFDPDNLRTVQA